MLDTMPKRKKTDGADEPKRPSRSGSPLHAWIDESIMEMLDEYVEGSDPKVSKTAVIESALRAFLRSVGKWPPPKEN